MYVIHSNKDFFVDEHVSESHFVCNFHNHIDHYLYSEKTFFYGCYIVNAFSTCTNQEYFYGGGVS